jgi:hypothetical protein
MGTISTLDLPPTLDIPPLWCPIPARIHPEAAGIDDHLLAWAKERDLIRSPAAAERFRVAGFGQFSAECYPRVSNLKLMAEWNGYNWIVDDQLDEGYAEGTHEDRVRLARELLDQIPLDMRIPRASSPLTATLADLWQRTAKPMSLAWRKRYQAHYRDWLGFTLLPHAQRERTRIPEQAPPVLHTFIRRRRLNSGCELSFDLVEPGALSEVPEQVADCDAYRAVRIAANDSISWHNDLYSIRKETARGDYDHLAIAVRRATRDTWAGALSQSAQMIEDITRDFLLACQDLRTMRPVFDLDDAAWARVEESLNGLGEWISGSLHWHMGSLRYQVVETTAEGELPSYIERHLL